MWGRSLWEWRGGGGGQCVGGRGLIGGERNQLPFTLADGKITRALSMGHDRRGGGRAAMREGGEVT